MPITTLEDLADAISQAGPDRDAAKDCAEMLLDHMHPLGRALDNRFTKAERSVLYDLQGLGIVGSTGFTETLPSGRKWQVREWYLRPEDVTEAAQEAREENESSVYDELDSEVWRKA